MAVTISANGQAIFVITDDMLNMFQYSISKSKLQSVIIGYIQSSLTSYVNEYKGMLQNDWLPKIRERYDTMPTQDNALGQLIFSQPDYLDYDQQNPEG